MYREGKYAKIIGSAKVQVDPGNVRSGAIIYHENVANVMTEAVSKACKEMNEELSNVVIGISGDLCLGLMTTIKAKKQQPTKISKKELDELNLKIEDSAYMQAQNEYMEINGTADSDLDIVTSSNVYLKLDGQRVTDINERMGSVVEMAAFNAFVPSHHITSIQKTVHEAGLSIEALGSEMYCIVQSIMKANPEDHDFVVVEIDGDYTNAAVVFGKGIVATRTLNVGFKHFIEGVSEKLGLTLAESEKMIKSYMQAKLSQQEASVIQNALKFPVDVWISGLELLFSEYSGVKTFAPKIYFTGEGTQLNELWTAITNETWIKSIPFKAHPEFKKFGFGDISYITDATGTVEGAEWMGTASLAIIKLETAEEDDQN